MKFSGSGTSGSWKGLNLVQGSFPMDCQSAMRAAPATEAKTPRMAMTRVLSLSRFNNRLDGGEDDGVTLYTVVDWGGVKIWCDIIHST